MLGALETKWKLGEFLDWYTRAESLGLKTLMLQDVVAKRRIHDNNSGIRHKNDYTDYIKIIRTIRKNRNENQKNN